MDILSSSLPQDKPQKFYVYTLAYPELMGGRVFYIGKGTITHNPRVDRINDHERKVKNGVWDCNEHKRETIKQIVDAGQEIVKNKIAYFEQETDAYMYEWALVFMSCWSEHLTNVKERPVTKAKAPLIEFPEITTPICIRYKHGRPRTYHKVVNVLEFTRKYPIRANTMRALLEGSTCSNWEIIQCTCE